MTGHFIHGRLVGQGEGRMSGLSVEEFKAWMAGLTVNQRAWLDTWSRTRFYDLQVVYTDPRYSLSRRAIRDTMERTWTR